MDRDNRWKEETRMANFSTEQVSKGWKSRFNRYVHDIEILNGETEEDFLSIGSSLIQFYDHAQGISGVSSNVVNVMSSREIEDAIEGLQAVMERIHVYLEMSEKKIIGKMDSLNRAFRLLNDIRDPIGDFRAIIKNMRYLSLSTKIHSSKIEQEGDDFRVLAGDITRLSTLIESKSAEIKKNIQSSQEIISHTIVHVMELEERHRSRLKEIMKNARSIVSSLKEKHTLSMRIANNISDMSHEISSNIGEIVEAVQFHDITRQQFEHVGAAIRKLIDQIDNGSGGYGKGEINSAIFTKDVCDLQLSQLRHAREELLTSMDTITDNLEMVSQNATVMSGEVRKIAGSEGDSERSFFDEMEQSISSASSTLSVLSDNAGANLELSRAMDDVIHTVGNMSTFTRDMDEIESDVEVIALNASIKAAKIGEQGMALGVVAQKMRHVSTVAHAQTSAVSEFVKSMSATSDELSSIIGTDKDSENKEIESIISELSTILTYLQTVSEKVMTDLDHVTKEGAILSRSIGKSLAGINIHRIIERLLDGVITGLTAVSCEASECIKAGEHIDKAAVLETLSEQYTMQSEHTIHQSHLYSDVRTRYGMKGRDGEKSSRGKNNGKKEGPGGNVEFF